MSEPTPTPELPERAAKGKRVTELLKVIEEAGDELMRIEFEDKAMGVERFKRIQNIAEEIQMLHKCMASRVQDFLKTDYALRTCTTRDLQAGFGDVADDEPLLLGQNAGLGAAFGMPRFDAVTEFARGVLARNGEQMHQGEPNDLISMLRSLMMTNQRQGDEREARERGEARTNQVKHLSEALEHLPEGSPHRARVQALLDTALKALEEPNAAHGAANPVAALPVVSPQLPRGRAPLGEGRQDDGQLREADGPGTNGAQGAG